MLNITVVYNLCPKVNAISWHLISVLLFPFVLTHSFLEILSTEFRMSLVALTSKYFFCRRVQSQTIIRIDQLIQFVRRAWIGSYVRLYIVYWRMLKNGFNNETFKKYWIHIFISCGEEVYSSIRKINRRTENNNK